MWLIVSFLVLAIGWVLFVGLQEHLPENFRLVEESGELVQGPAGRADAGRPGPRVEHVAGWTVVREAGQVELRRDLGNPVQAGGQRFDAPTFKVTCYDARLYLRLEPRLALAHGQVGLAGAKSVWAPGAGAELLSPAPGPLLAHLAGSGASVPLELSFRDYGTHQFTLNTSGLSQAAQALPGPCRKSLASG